MFQTAKSFLFFLTLGVIFQGLITHGLIKVVITSIEKRFSLKSTESGAIASSFDAGSLLLMIPVTYFGGKLGVNRPRYISVGLVILALGAFIWTIPHFTTLAYNPGDEGGESLSEYLYVFILAQLLVGFGYTPLETLGIAYIDDNVDSSTSSVYIAIVQTGIVLGPAAGFVLGGQLLNFHTDFIDDSRITSASSLWVGAWWPGFLVTSIGSLLCATSLFFFPTSLKQNSEEEKDQNQNSEKMLKQFKSLFTNYTYILISLSDAVDFLILTGLSTFFPKYIEHQYQMTSAAAGQFSGLLVIIAGVSGTIFSGVFVKKFVTSTRGAVLTCMVAQCIALPMWFIFLLSCPNLSYAGISRSSSSMLLECNMNMSCSTSSFDPICGSDGLMYLSPCLAGCQHIHQVSNNFSDCRCIIGDATASRQLCDNNCGYFIPFMLVTLIIFFLTFWINTPSTVALIRSVETHEKSVALGFQRLLVGLFGGVPGPILFGYFIDSYCLLWNNGEFTDIHYFIPIFLFLDESDQRSCLVYDNEKFSILLCSICFVAKLFSLLLYVGSLVFMKKSEGKNNAVYVIDNPTFEHD